MRAMDGTWSCKGWPFHLPSSSKLSAFSPPFSAYGASVPSVDFAEFEGANGYDSFSRPLGGLDSAPFSEPCSHGYSGFPFTDPRVSSPDWSSLHNLNTKPREIEHPCQSPSSGNQFLVFSEGQFNRHLDLGPNSSNNVMLSNWNVPVSEARPRIPNSRANLHIDNFLNAVDECNPAVLFKNHDALHPELIDKIEECLASYLEGPKDFHVEIAKYGRESCEISNINKMRNEISSQEKGLTGLATKLSVSNSVSQECNSDVVVNDGRSDVGKQVEEKKFMSQNQNSFCHCKDVGFNVSECLECNSSQEAENVSSSPSFIAAAPEKASAKVPAPKIDIQMLIKMMHNMSEVLLGHCLTDEFQLNEQERGILENVINNLWTCTPKNSEQKIPVQKRFFPELDSGNLVRESPQPLQSSSVKESRMSKVGAERANVKQGKERGMISDSPCISGGYTEMEKVDNVTKAMKRILGENFRDEEEPVSHILLYKSLWLEAEAQLRSLIYRARFELEKYSSKHGDNDLVQGEQSKTKADFELSSYQNSVNSVSNSRSPKHISALHGVNLTEPSGLKASPNHSVDSFNIASQEYLSRSMDSHARDMALILALEGTESLKAQNPNETCASESLSLTDDKKPETRDSSDADVKESDLVLEDNQEIQLSSCQRVDNGLVTDDSDDLTSDWEVV